MSGLAPGFAVVLDTDVYSYLTRGDPHADRFRPHLAGRFLCLSFATVAEVYKGAYKARWSPSRIAKIDASLRNFVVIPYDMEISRVCGQLLASLEMNGRRMEEFDAWIAATAIRHGLPLATNNRRHFDGIPGLRLVP